MMQQFTAKALAAYLMVVDHFDFFAGKAVRR
jgi:hypothetical protein